MDKNGRVMNNLPCWTLLQSSPCNCKPYKPKLQGSAKVNKLQGSTKVNKLLKVLVLPKGKTVVVGASNEEDAKKGILKIKQLLSTFVSDT